MRKSFLVLLLAVVSLPISGCGGVSSSNLKRAASRRRDPDPADVAPATVQPKAGATVTPTAAKAGSLAADTAVAKSAADAAPPGPPPPPPVESTEANAEPPPKPVTETERRARSIENLEKIGKALAAYAAKRGQLPPSAENYDQERFVSWRVLILPELGYPDLYKRFRTTQPWDSGHNKLLMDYIPREYQSPERFDTKTNYLSVTGAGMAFNADAATPVPSIKDGLDNTLAVVEVDDKFAVEWTKPGDHVPVLERPFERLGSLRGEGTFGVLASGRVVLLPRELPVSRMAALLTISGGEPIEPAKLFLKPPTAEPPPPTLATTADDPASANQTAPTADTAPESATSAPGAAGNARILAEPFAPDPGKLPVPDEATLAKSRELLRQLYAEQYAQARTRQDRQDLLRKLLADVKSVEQNAADLHELARVARDLAVSLGDATTALAACDILEQRFQVDPLPLRLKVLQDLAKQAGAGSAADLGDGALKEALRLGRQAVEVDRYEIAIPANEAALGFARLKGLSRGDISRLSLQADELEAAKSLYLAAERGLAALKDRPQDADANEAVGGYLCFVKNRWEAGLPFLARASDIKLRGIASLELAADRSADAVLDLADQYWELAVRFKLPQRRGLHLRAIYCYELVSTVLPSSLEKVKAQKRLEEANAMYGKAEVDRILAPIRTVRTGKATPVDGE